MIKFIFSNIIFFLLISIVQAQSIDPKIIEGFHTGNMNLVKPHMANEVEVVLPTHEGKYSQDQGYSILNGFMDELSINSFSIIHQGSSPTGTTYHIGILNTNSMNYRIYLLKSNEDVSKITVVRIEEDE